MRYLGIFIFIVLLSSILQTLIDVADGKTAGVEFNGKIYQSIDAAQQAARSLTDLDTDTENMSGGDVSLYCGQRLTIAKLIRGYYDGRYDPVVCFTSESESDQLYADNRSIETSYKYLIWGFAAFVLMACLIAVRYIYIRIGVK